MSNRYEKKFVAYLTRHIFVDRVEYADNSKIKRNKFFWGFMSNMKVGTLILQGHLFTL